MSQTSYKFRVSSMTVIAEISLLGLLFIWLMQHQLHEFLMDQWIAMLYDNKIMQSMDELSSACRRVLNSTNLKTTNHQEWFQPFEISMIIFCGFLFHRITKKLTTKIYLGSNFLIIKDLFKTKRFKREELSSITLRLKGANRAHLLITPQKDKEFHINYMRKAPQFHQNIREIWDLIHASEISEKTTTISPNFKPEPTTINLQQRYDQDLPEIPESKIEQDHSLKVMNQQLKRANHEVWRSSVLTYDFMNNTYQWIDTKRGMTLKTSMWTHWIWIFLLINTTLVSFIINPDLWYAFKMQTLQGCMEISQSVAYKLKLQVFMSDLSLLLIILPTIILNQMNSKMVIFKSLMFVDRGFIFRWVFKHKMALHPYEIKKIDVTRPFLFGVFGMANVNILKTNGETTTLHFLKMKQPQIDALILWHNGKEMQKINSTLSKILQKVKNTPSQKS